MQDDCDRICISVYLFRFVILCYSCGEGGGGRSGKGFFSYNISKEFFVSKGTKLCKVILTFKKMSSYNQMSIILRFPYFILRDNFRTGLTRSEELSRGSRPGIIVVALWVPMRTLVAAVAHRGPERLQKCTGHEFKCSAREEQTRES